MTRDEWKQLFELSDRHGFVIVADECYSEIYFDEANPPVGALAAAAALGREDFPRLVTISSLSKRSSAPAFARASSPATGRSSSASSSTARTTAAR
jgi:Aspartate/tyrosine/aromatic aminotransferase